MDPDGAGRLRRLPRPASPTAPFEHCFTSVVDEADARLWASVAPSPAAQLTPSARNGLRRLLIEDLCGLCAPVLFDRFAAMRAAAQVRPDPGGSTVCYDAFIDEMGRGGAYQLFEEKPVLLRLIAALTRQWLSASAEFVTRLDADLDRIRHNLLQTRAEGRVVRIDGGLSDRHDGGRSVLRVGFDDGLTVLYKPKDLRLDAAWHSLVARLNPDAPVQLRAASVMACDGYGWAEFIAHSACTDTQNAGRFFRRAGAWLALFHSFGANDIHQENLIAAADHPVPIDLETILQAGAAGPADPKRESEAYEAARELIADSVMAVGLLPGYGRSAGISYPIGGVSSDWTATTKLVWDHLNSDAMTPAMVPDTASATANLPRVGSRYVGLGEHLDDFIRGFTDYARHLLSRRDGLFDAFIGLPVRKVVRPTHFYHLLQQRLRDDRTMSDGVLWSVQADFLARLADWDSDEDPAWPLQQAERAALFELNVPLLTISGDGREITDTSGVTIPTSAAPGLERARERMRRLDTQEIAWQVDVIRQTSTFLAATSEDAGPRQLVTLPATVASREVFVAEADRIAREIACNAVRRGSSAAWIGLGWFADSDVSQLAVLGNDLYNGTSGIAIFFAAHAKIMGQPKSGELALAAISQLRAQLASRRAPHIARLLGIGGATGLSSVVYALSVMSGLLGDDDLLADAHHAATLISDDLIAADSQRDVIGGSAGAILCLLHLYNRTGVEEVLVRAVKCGEHLLLQRRVGPCGRRSWPGGGPNDHVLNGMSHGAAGFAYALASLTGVTGDARFADAAAECMEFERQGFDVERADWPDLRVPEDRWRSQWCHGAVGIGLARLGMLKRGADTSAAMAVDIEHALASANRGWPGHVDTLCCGAVGSVELFREAAKVLNRDDYAELSSRRLSAIVHAQASAGGYRFNGTPQRFNPGLFRGLAGVGYTYLRELDGTLPNLLIWE